MKIIAVLAILALIVAVIVAAIYVFGMFVQTKFIADAATDLGNKAVGYVQQNIPAVTAAATGIAGIGTVALSKYQSIQKEASSKISVVKSQVDGLIQEKKEILETAKSEVTAATSKFTEVQQQFTDYKQQVEPQLAKIQTYEAQVQAVKDENSQFVKSLMRSADGALVTNGLDGKIYSVLKVPPEVQIK
jgi:hypothetical protein